MEQEYIVYVDCDGVIADFNSEFFCIVKMKYGEGLYPEPFISTYSKSKFWNLIDSAGEGFWSDMPLMPGAKDLMGFIYDNFLHMKILTASTRKPESKSGKRKWIRRHFSFISNSDVIIVEERALKAKYASTNSILIDDMTGNIDKWVSNGGIGILYKSAQETIKELQKYV